MSAAAGAIISGVLQGTGGAGSEFAPAVQKGMDNNSAISAPPKQPEINKAEVSTPDNQEKPTWQSLAADADKMRG